jgi:hypothetical protein
MEIKPIVEFVSEYLKNPHEVMDWNGYLEENGYYCVWIEYKHARLKKKEMLAWANELYGEGHCYWTGSCFWFDREEDAVLFALKWV